MVDKNEILVVRRIVSTFLLIVKYTSEEGRKNEAWEMVSSPNHKYWIWYGRLPQWMCGNTPLTVVTPWVIA